HRCGYGGIYGTFSHRYPPKEQIQDTKFDEQPDQQDIKIKPEKRNFFTNPPKRGTGYGFPNVTISPDYKYMSSPYNRAHEIEKVVNLTDINQQSEKDYRTNHGKSEKDLPPFKPSSPPHTVKYIAYLITKGIFGTFNKYPNALSAATVEKAKGNNDSQIYVFRPSGTSHSFPIKSIVEMNIHPSRKTNAKFVSHELAFSMPVATVE
ncbi:hypothetical protein ROZALSC1DRAFT_25983, partial [Rozella allomycis CSF55]